jgi:hypothetical protein
VLNPVGVVSIVRVSGEIRMTPMDGKAGKVVASAAGQINPVSVRPGSRWLKSLERLSADSAWRRRWIVGLLAILTL